MSLKSRIRFKKPHKTPLLAVRLRGVLFVILISALILPQALFTAPGLAASPIEQAQAILEQLTPQERVGQLFLVTFEGTDVSADSNIYDLIYQHHIGGVVLLRDKNNFTAGDNTLENAQSLTRQLQLNAWGASLQNRLDPATNEFYSPQFIPLFIGIQQEGDGYPYDNILSGLTPLPNEMAIGATWNPDLANQVGAVLGNELSLLGFNFLIGPSLDVLEAPHREGSTDLGTRTFGGDPYWVGEMGKAYIEGVHQGSNGRMAVAANHFPGHGGSDRLPEEEVATVRKLLEQLEKFELAPFYAVTGEAPSAEAQTDALLSSHIRYQGFQGNIRATTRPVSLDPQALNRLLELKPLADWRESGGVLVSDNLGSQAMRRFYDLPGRTFDPVQVALSAFLAGNDLLYVADFSSGENEDSYTGAIRTLESFTQKYREDPAFAERVDRAVTRIIALKYRLYGDFSLNEVIANTSDLSQIGKSEQVTFEVARQSATLISPNLSELDDTIPDPPNQNDRLVFITDSRKAQQCATCPSEPILDMRALEDVVLRRYGPLAGGGQITLNNLASYSLSELQQMLASGAGDSDIEMDMKRANWIVFAMLNSTDSAPSYSVLNNFLTNRPDLFQQKRLIVFAFNAPYYLDATNISKLTAYYGLYSKAPDFIDVAAYLLFREMQPTGALPISVSGVYDLNEALFPDPDQLILLRLDLPGSEIPETQTTPEPASPEFRVGDVIPVTTGVILDHNGHRVPDGTQVEFVLNSTGGEVRQVESTLDGIAETSFLITNSGFMEIRAESEPAKQSEVLRFEVPAESQPGAPSQTPTPESTATPTPTPTPTTTPVTGETITPPPQPKRPQLADWAMAFLVASAVAWSSYRLAALMGQVRWGIRGGFMAVIGGLLAYSYLALDLPGSERLVRNSIALGVFLITLIGTGLGLGLAWLWRAISAPGKNNL
jgi:beta-N-acetylhexosaminidase